MTRAPTTPTSPKVRAASGNACTTTGPIPTASCMTTTDSNMWGGASGHTYTFTPQPDGTTEVDVVVVREGKNFKGRVLGLGLGVLGKRVLSEGAGKDRQGHRSAQRCATGIGMSVPDGAALLALARRARRRGAEAPRWDPTAPRQHGPWLAPAPPAAPGAATRRHRSGADRSDLARVPARVRPLPPVARRHWSMRRVPTPRTRPAAELATS